MPRQDRSKREKLRAQKSKSDKMNKVYVWRPSSDFFQSGGGSAKGGEALSPNYEEDDFCLITGKYQVHDEQNKNSVKHSQDVEVGYKMKDISTCTSPSQIIPGNYSLNRYPAYDYQDNHTSGPGPQTIPDRRVMPRFGINYRSIFIMAVICGTFVHMESGRSISGYTKNIVTAFRTDLFHSQTMENTSSNNMKIYPEEIQRMTAEAIESDNADKAQMLPQNGQEISFDQARAEILAYPSEPLPVPKLEGYKNSWDAHSYERDIAVFWHVPKAGGSTIKDIVGACHGLVISNENGVLDGHGQDTELKVVKIADQGETLFVNVDTTTVSGINRAVSMSFGSSGLVDLVITPFVHDAERLFSSLNQGNNSSKGRLFATFRHPIDRAVSLFKYLQYADWEPTYSPEIKSWTLEQYARSNQIENNWMTRYLSNEFEGELTNAHLQLAMEILRRKFLVGLISDLEGSMSRFEAYFGWRYTINPTAQETCRESLFTVGTNTNRNTKIEVPPEGSVVYNLIANQNIFDMELYNYIEVLYEEQSAFVQNRPEDYRLFNSECSKCSDMEETALRSLKETLLHRNDLS